MNLLVLTSRLPWPPDRGDRLLALRMLEQLAPAHRVSLASFVDGREPGDARTRLEALGIETHVVRLPPALSLVRTALALPGTTPLQVAYYRSARMDALVDRLSSGGGFDVAIVHMVRMCAYGLRARARTRIAFLTDSYGLSMGRRAAAERGPRAAVTRLEAERIGRYERAMTARFDRTWLVSRADLAGFPAVLHDRIDIVPNGFPEALLALPVERPNAETLLFVGHLGVPHNVDAAHVLVRDVLPRVRARRPGVMVRIVGADPSPAVRSLHAPPGVTVTGFVPDLATEYGRAHVFVGPLRFAAGVQNKLIESMAAALPVITSSIAGEGLGATPDRDLLVADSAEGVADATCRLLADEAARRELGLAGRAFVGRRFGWAHVRAALDRAVGGLPVRHRPE